MLILTSRIPMTLALGAALLLSACGQTPTDRAMTGAGFGAAGAVAGAATDPSEIYLGQPVWK